MEKKYLVAGGDLRFARLAEFLALSGCFVYTVGFDSGIVPSENVHSLKSIVNLSERVDYLILPLPVSNDGVNINMPFSGNSLPISQAANVLKEGGIAFGGRITDNVKGIFSSQGKEIIDYSLREEFAVLNAKVTAEGAVQAAMEETESILSGQKILILGMGRIAKCLIHILNGFGADITAASRRYDHMAWAEVYGCKSLDINTLGENLTEYDIIFNTVPEVILDREKLSYIGRNCLVIDLASKPGGVDFDTAASLGIRAIWLLSLPGRTAPLTAGVNIGKTIFNILNERSKP
jgi:dipicolinate synthase subunit A